MLNRDQQQLLGSLAAGMAADALLDRGTLQGGQSANQTGCWVNYNRKAVWLEDHTELSAAWRTAGGDASQTSRRVRPTAVLTVTWAQAAAYGAALPCELRTELQVLRRTERAEDLAWWDFSNERGGWPWRRRFATDEEHEAAEAEWDAANSKHLVALSELRNRLKVTVARALPLTVDDEPVNLLELLDQQPATPTAPTGSTSMQAAAVRAATTPPAPQAAPDEGLFTLPITAPRTGR